MLFDDKILGHVFNVTLYFVLNNYLHVLKKVHAKVILYQHTFLLSLWKVYFTLIKNKDNVNGIDLYDYSFLFTAYADDSTFCLKDIASVRVLVDTFKVSSCFSGLKPKLISVQLLI